MKVQRALSTFQNHRSSGPDNIDIRMLKKIPDVIAPILQCIYNKYCVDLGCIPNQLKQRFIVPLKKPGKPSNQSTSYQPISLTSYVAKILEKILCYRLVNYIIELQLLASCHFAYLRARSTQDAVALLVDRITKQFSAGKDVHSVFFDFSAAFDCVRANVMAWKLEHEFFISGCFLRFMKAFLSEEQQRYY